MWHVEASRGFRVLGFRVISNLSGVISIVLILIALLTTTHESASKNPKSLQEPQECLKNSRIPRASQKTLASRKKLRTQEP